MLRRLRIENFVLIREADLAFGPRLNAVTGETGAGKTILAQAIGLLLGAPGDAGYLGPGAAEAYVEADFALPEGILEEEALAMLAERLLAMSGQFEQRRLARPSFQLDVLDAFVGEEQLRRRVEHGRA